MIHLRFIILIAAVEIRLSGCVSRHDGASLDSSAARIAQQHPLTRAPDLSEAIACLEINGHMLC